MLGPYNAKLSLKSTSRSQWRLPYYVSDKSSILLNSQFVGETGLLLLGNDQHDFSLHLFPHNDMDRSGTWDKTRSNRSHLSKLVVGSVPRTDFRKPGSVSHDLRTDNKSVGSGWGIKLAQFDRLHTLALPSTSTHSPWFWVWIHPLHWCLQIWSRWHISSNQFGGR